VKAADALLDKKTKVCGTIKGNRELQFDFHWGAKQLKKGDFTL
jgi:hypothetical protein